MRLQEHRMSDTVGMNQKLKHITVLEEAHHLLRKTSGEQSQEGANLQGKSVEMITNAIAEMRTYGEGFIIADQSPNLLDSSVIRNTNTKIILRLPDVTDRNEVGAAASLNEDQINEIPKLKTGVAIVYPNNWLQPILCAVEKYEEHQPYIHQYNELEVFEVKRKNSSRLLKILLSGRVSPNPNVDELIGDIEGLKSWLISYPFDRSLKRELLVEISLLEKGQRIKYWNQAWYEELSTIVWHVLDAEKFSAYAKGSNSFAQYNEKFSLALSKFVELESPELEQALIQCVLFQQSLEKPGFKDFYFNWVEDLRKKEHLV